MKEEAIKSGYQHATTPTFHPQNINVQKTVENIGDEEEQQIEQNV